MSILSKLFNGNEEAEKAAKEMAKEVLSGLLGGNGPLGTQRTESISSASWSEQAERASGPSGFSWGEEMPAEENQYNYNGVFWAYFESIFQSDLSEYRYEKKEISPNKRIAYTFFSGGSRVLVVELMSDSSSAKRLRSECRREGIPYLRFYIDHPGWWNTRSYVVGRMRDALGG